MPDTDLKDLTLGRRIQLLRRRQAMTQEALAEQLSITAQAVSKWENDLSCPDIMTLPTLARLLGVSTDTLLTGETALAAPAAKPRDKLILRMLIQNEDERIGINLPYSVFMLGTRYHLLHFSVRAEGETDAAAQRMLKDFDPEHLVSLVESGVTGKLAELHEDDGILTIWTE